jgi:hypothetical protein
MGPTKFLELADNETLRIQLAVPHDESRSEELNIGWNTDDAKDAGVISLLIIHYLPQLPYCVATQACLTAEEIDLVIHGLQEAKKKLKTLQVGG